jgi:hypothetical protein
MQSPSHPEGSPAPLDDELERDRARHDDVALVAYHQKWQRRLARLQRRYPERWHVAGLSIEEVRDALTLRLLEVVRGEPEHFDQYRHHHMEWGLAVIKDHLTVLRRTFRLGAIPTDFRDEPVREREPSQEEQLLEHQAAARRRAASQRASEQLSRPQRRWLAAMKLAANCGEFFASSDELNLSAASRVLQKHRSSAQRAYRELQAQFRRELTRLE